MWYFAIDQEDPEALAYDLEPYPTAEVMKDDAGYVRIDQHLIVVTTDEQPGFIRTILENVLGYEIARSADELIYE